jgi:hypothetical protein
MWEVFTMSGPKIQTPRGSIIITPGGKAELRWNVGFQKKWQGRFDNAQEYVDSEVIRVSEPFVPKVTGMLEKSGTLGTVPGSGEVSYITPYARRRYYSPGKVGSQTGPLRGPFWFKRAMAIYKPIIQRGVELFLKGKNKSK